MINDCVKDDQTFAHQEVREDRNDFHVIGCMKTDLQIDEFTLERFERMRVLEEAEIKAIFFMEFLIVS